MPVCLFFKYAVQNADQENNYNVKEVWKMNYTGAGIVVAVVDDGLSKGHPELRKNYVSVFFSDHLQLSIEIDSFYSGECTDTRRQTNLFNI